MLIVQTSSKNIVDQYNQNSIGREMFNIITTMNVIQTTYRNLINIY